MMDFGLSKRLRAAFCPQSFKVRKPNFWLDACSFVDDSPTFMVSSDREKASHRLAVCS